MDDDRRMETTRSRAPTGTSAGTAPATSARSEISAFLGAAQATRNVATAGRLVFALDATMSRQPTWDRACSIQAEMFTAAGEVGRLAMQLVYFRGFNECRKRDEIVTSPAPRPLQNSIHCF